MNSEQLNVSTLTYSEDLSKLIYKKHKKHIKAKLCYNNTFWIATNFPFENPEKVKILFCYLGNSDDNDSWYIRHAFCVYDGQIIEPLPNIIVNDDVISDIVPIAFLDMDEYLDFLLEEDGLPALPKSLLQSDIDAYNNSDINLNPIDLTDIIVRFTKNQSEFIDITNHALAYHEILEFSQLPKSSL